MASRKTERFVDTGFASDPRYYTVPHPLACKKPPSNFSPSQFQLYHPTWIEAMKKYNMNPFIFKGTTPMNCHVALIAYTLELDDLPTQVYAQFNKLLREMSSESDWYTASQDSSTPFPYDGFFYLLTIAEEKGIDNNCPDIHTTLYRGVNYHLEREPKKGEPFYFHYFASCSARREMAENFMGPKGTMIKIKNGAQVALGISHYSAYPEEAEVLVFPRNKFVVESFEKKNNIHTLVLVNAGALS